MKRLYVTMQHPKFFKFLIFLVSGSFLSTTSFGDNSPSICSPLLCPPRDQENQEPVFLQETLERAYMQNSDLDAARAGLRVTDENVSQANAEWRPSLSVLGSQQHTQVYPIDAHGFARRTHNSTTQYTATIAQNVFKGGGTVANIGVQESNVLAGKAGLFTTEQQTLITAIQAHTSILAGEAAVKYRKESLDFNKKNWEFADARFEVGEGSRTDVEAARAQYESAKAELSNAIGVFESSIATYTRQVGSSPGKLAPANLILELPKCVEEALEVAKVRNPAIIQARYALEAANYNVNLQIAGLLPTVDVQGQVGNNRVGGTQTGAVRHPKQTNLSFQAVVAVPLYAQGIPNSKVRQAYQQVAQQKILLVSAQRQVAEAVKIAWDNLVAVRESVKGFLAQVKAQELAVEGAVEEVNVGTKTMIDVIQLQQKLIDAQINLTNAQKTLIDSGYQVLQAMGRLTACDLRLRVQYYDPDAYYNEYKDAWIQFWQGKDLRYVKGENEI